MVTYFLNRPIKVFNLDESSWSWLSATVVVAGVDRVGVPGRELGREVAGVAKGVLEVDVMVWRTSSRSCNARRVRMGRNLMVEVTSKGVERDDRK